MTNRILKNREVKVAILLILDLSFIFFSYFLAYIFRFYMLQMTLKDVVGYYKGNFAYIAMAAIIYIFCLFINRQYKSIWTLAGVGELVKGVEAILEGYVAVVVVSLLMPNRVPLSVATIAAIIIILCCNGMRIGWRVLRRAILFTSTAKNNSDWTNVLVVGAGSAGALVVNEIKKRPELKKKVVAFVDDDRQKRGKYIQSIKISGNRRDIKTIVEKFNVGEVIIAIANLKPGALKELINICKNLKVKVKIMPGLSEMIDCKFSIDSIRDVDVNDLLGREAINLDYEGISKYIENKVILVTGGGGSIGSELCRQITKFNPKMLIIFDIYENNAYEIQMELERKYPKLNLVTLIGSVRDRNRLTEVLSDYRPDVIFHAAAHKHVPLMEDSPVEAIKNNVLGTINVAELASKYNVEKFVLISTDKAVNPTNIMGASKRMCEMVIQAINEKSKTDYVAVRFGNVLGSNGSVVPLFKKQIKEGGPVTLTHKEITRYFMTIPEAAQLVLQAGAYAKGGEIFILDMGEPVKIYDLAVNLIKLSGYEPDKDIEIKITGLRPGEKLYEELLMSEEGLTNTAHKKIFIAKPGYYDLGKLKQAVNQLLYIGVNGDIDEFKDAVSEAVPTYIRTDIEKTKKEVAATSISK